MMRACANLRSPCSRCCVSKLGESSVRVCVCVCVCVGCVAPMAVLVRALLAALLCWTKLCVEGAFYAASR